MGWLVTSSLRFGRLVVAAAVGLLVVAAVQLSNASVDVYPEFEPPAVQVQAEALGLSAQEVEQLITVPLEQDLLNGVPWLQHIRSESMPGLSAINLEFEPRTDLYAARQMVQERMTQAKALPNVGTPPVMIQPTSATSRVAMIGLTSDTVSTMQMSVLARWQIKPRLMSIPGVANVTIWGERDRQLQVQVDPDRLRSKHVSLTQLIESTGNALWVSPLSFVEASTPGTGGFVETPSQRLGVQHVQPISTAKQLGDVAVEGVAGRPLRIADVATLREDHQPLIGDASLDGTSGLMLVVERFPGANTAQVTADVEDALDAMAPGLSGITVNPNVFRPADYLSTALDNLGVVGGIGLVLLVVALAVVLLSWRLALIAALAVPLSLLTAAYVVHLRGDTLTLMTLMGLAAAAAVVVDDAVGDVEEIRRRLRGAPAGERVPVTHVISDVVLTRRAPLLFASVIVLLTLVPVLTMGGLPAAFGRPAVLSFALALAASMLVALIVTPALAALLLRNQQKPLRAGLLDRWVTRGFDRLAAPAIARPAWVAIAAIVLAAAALTFVVIDGAGDPLPTLHDRNLLIRLRAAPGTSLPEMQRISTAAAVELRKIPGVTSAGSHAGRAITSDEVVDVNSAEIWLRIGDDANYDETLAAVRSTVRDYPGLATRVSTYAADRVAAESTPTGQDLVVRVYGEDLEQLRSTADDVRNLLTTVPGVLSPRVALGASQPTIEIQLDLAAAQRHGLRPGDVRREASTLISGLTVGSLYEEQKIFDVVVWGGPPTRQSVASLSALLLDTPAGGHVRLGEVATVRVRPNPAVVTHDAVSRSLDVSATVSGRDITSVTAEVNSRLRGMAMPYEFRAEVLGDNVDRANASRQLLVVSLVVAGLVFLLLQAATGSWRRAAVVFVALPLALTGGVAVAPAMNGISAVGVLAALLGVLALTARQSLVLLRRADQLATEDLRGSPAVTTAARELAPSVIATALVVAALFAAPAVLSSAPGLELLHPLAVTLLCGLISSVLVVLVVVPAFCLAVAAKPISEAHTTEVTA